MMQILTCRYNIRLKQKMKQVEYRNYIAKKKTNKIAKCYYKN